jgi:hypothetical protein
MLFRARGTVQRRVPYVHRRGEYRLLFFWLLVCPTCALLCNADNDRRILVTREGPFFLHRRGEYRLTVWLPADKYFCLAGARATYTLWLHISTYYGILLSYTLKW